MNRTFKLVKIPRAPSIGEEILALQLRGLGFEREFKFHPERRWKFDFALPAQKLAVEIEGGIYSNGRHTRPEGFAADMEKYNAAAMMGWRVLRYTTEMVKSGRAEREIREALR